MTEEQKRAQVQELYRHLDHHRDGDVYMAWYAQLRAMEATHAEALAATVKHFHLTNEDWYKARMGRRD